MVKGTIKQRFKLIEQLFLGGVWVCDLVSKDNFLRHPLMSPGSPGELSVWLGGYRLGEDDEAWVWSTGEPVMGDLWEPGSQQGIVLSLLCKNCFNITRRLHGFGKS